MSEIKIVEAHARQESYRQAYEHPRRNGRVTVYVTPQGESIMEQFLAGRHTRPYKAWKPVVKDFLVKFLGFNEDIKVSWSQTAGCTCPCSPGFVIKESDGYPATPGHFLRDFTQVGSNRDVDIWLTLERDEYADEVRAVVEAAVGESE